LYTLTIRHSRKLSTGRKTLFTTISAFERETGLPALVNTSFNVHEEPIVNTPSECIKALRDGRIDFVVTDQGLYDCPRA
jgi:predicted NodU family carbamoyl transferase